MSTVIWMQESSLTALPRTGGLLRRSIAGLPNCSTSQMLRHILSWKPSPKDAQSLMPFFVVDPA